MKQHGAGQIVTFYSYKGGTGRTMALANAAWILAANGHRVLVADWDLESPGLHRFLAPFLDPDQVSTTGGVMDLILEYEWATSPSPGEDQRAEDRPPDWHRDFAKVEKYAFSVEWEFPGGGVLDILLAGRHNPDYATNVASLSWENFYNRLGGAQFFDALRDDMKDRYEYTLIDSRTGLSDVADICTIHLPDVVVDCFTLSDQGIDGAAEVARRIRSYEGRRRRVILPVPMRVDEGEKGKADAGRSLAKRRFAGLPTGMTDAQRRDYWLSVEVPYKTYYAYEEMLATFGDVPGSRASLLSAYETLVGHITDHRVTSMPVMDEALRLQTITRFERKPAIADEVVGLRYAGADQAWAEWVQAVLNAAKVRVVDAAEPTGARVTRDLTLVSRSYLGVQEARGTQPVRRRVDAPELALYVDSTVPAADQRFEAWASFDGLTAEQATHQVLQLVGRTAPPGEKIPQARLPRFPSNQAPVFNAPTRNVRFTGREHALSRLRMELRAAGEGGVPVALRGGAGVGKTQVAIEYAHRFRGAYDVVWWINADPPQFVDVAMADLGTELRLPRRPTVAENTDAVKRWLRRAGQRADGAAPIRWLLIFDNAESLENVRSYLPQGDGHVLVTTRNPDWADLAQVVDVDVFEQSESVEHLRTRIGRRKITSAEAGQVAEAVGHLPILVATAGAWLADTRTPVAGYLAALERVGPVRDTVKEVWKLSLQRLRDGSPGAYRLLQLASALEPEIALDLLYSDRVARLIAPFDEEVARQVEDRVSERDIAASLVQQINKLALIKMDDAGQQVLIHRLLQRALRDLMSPADHDAVRHDVHLVLAGSRPQGEVDDPVHQDQFRILWPHLDGSDAVHCTEDTVRELIIDRIRYIWLLGGYEQGAEYAERADAAWSAQLSRPDEVPGGRRALQLRLLHLRFNRANVLRSLGRFEQALRLDEDTLRQQETLIGETQPDTLLTAGGYGGDLRALGRYADALARDLKTYQASVERFGEDHPRALRDANNLAASYRLIGDFQKALDLDRETYRKLHDKLGQNHPGTLRSANNLGRDLREAGEYEASAALLRSVVAGYQGLYGEHAKDALTTQANLAASLRSTGGIEQAAELLDDAHTRLDRSLGPRSPDTVLCRLSRAANLLLQGAGGHARAEFTDIQAICTELFGASHPYVLLCRSNLAVAMADAGDGAAAYELAQSVTASLEAVLGERHPFTMAAAANLSVFALQNGRTEAGRTLLREVVDRFRGVLSAEHPDTLRARGNLAIAEQRTGPEPTDLEPARIIDELANRIGAHHPSVIALRAGRYVRRVLDPHPY